MSGFNAVMFDNGDTLFYKPNPQAAIARIAASLDRPIDDATAAHACWAVKARKRALADPSLVFQRNRSAEGHRRYYTSCYAPLDEIVPGLADAFYEQFKTAPESMIPYPDTESTLLALRQAGLAIGIVSNTGWNIRGGYERAGFHSLIDSYVLSFEHGIAKPEREMWQLACTELDVRPQAAVMVGNNPYADSGASELGCTAVILPAVDRGQKRGLSVALGLVGIDHPVTVPAT